jgi:hypothetical protein
MSTNSPVSATRRYFIFEFLLSSSGDGAWYMNRAFGAYAKTDILSKASATALFCGSG